MEPSLREKNEKILQNVKDFFTRNLRMVMIKNVDSMFMVWYDTFKLEALGYDTTKVKY